MSPRKAHVVLLPAPDGSVAMHAMKEWLRQHPDQIPDGLDPTQSTSHQLRMALKRQGWTVQETETEVRLLPPGERAETIGVLAEIEEAASELQDRDDGEDPAFGLEYQLRDFLAQNLPSIPVNGRRLRVFIDPAGREGIEYRTAVGPIDLLAVDDEGSFYVFELKRGRTPDYTIGQLARYMGWVSQTIGRDKRVYGVIVAKAISDTLKYAVHVVPNVSLFEYEVSFRLQAPAALPTAATS